MIVDFLAKSKVVGAMFSRYNVDIDKIHDVDIRFGNIPVSAKTRDEVIFINEAFLEDGSFANELHYIVHELCHWLQQHTDDPYDLIPDGKMRYLDMLTEVEAFCFQVRFMREFYGNARAEKYVEDLLDFHSIKGEERASKKKVFLLIQ
jgi:hypothetical protein